MRWGWGRSEEGNYPRPAHSSHPAQPQWGEKPRETVNVSPEAGLTERLRPTPGDVDCSPSPTPHRHVIKGLFTAVPWTWYLISGNLELLQGTPKGKKRRWKRPSKP